MREKLLKHAEANLRLIEEADDRKWWDVAGALRNAHEGILGAILNETSVKLEKAKEPEAPPVLQRRVKVVHQIPVERGGRLL